MHDFESKDYKMSAETFAKNLLIFMPYKQYKTYCDQIDKNQEKWGDMTVSLSEYITFQYFLEEIDHIEEAANEYRLIDKKIFKKLLKDF